MDNSISQDVASQIWQSRSRQDKGDVIVKWQKLNVYIILVINWMKIENLKKKINNYVGI